MTPLGSPGLSDGPCPLLQPPEFRSKAVPTLTPPTRDQGPAALDRLFVRYKIARGVSLLVTGASVVEMQYPSQTDIAAADHFYQGGMVHTISDAEATTLTNAGYGAYIT